MSLAAERYEAKRQPERSPFTAPKFSLERIHLIFDILILEMDLVTIANIATALTVLTGVILGLVEAHRARRARQERAAFAAVQAILTPE